MGYAIPSGSFPKTAVVAGVVRSPVPLTTRGRSILALPAFRSCSSKTKAAIIR